MIESILQQFELDYEIENILEDYRDAVLSNVDPHTGEVSYDEVDAKVDIFTFREQCVERINSAVRDKLRVLLEDVLPTEGS